MTATWILYSYRMWCRMDYPLSDAADDLDTRTTGAHKDTPDTLYLYIWIYVS